MRDIPSVCRLVELIMGDEKLLSYFSDSLERILYLFAIPPMLTSSSELLNCKRDLMEYFNFLAYFLIDFNAETSIMEWALRALWCLIDNYRLPERYYVPLALRRKAVGESIVGENIAEALRVASEEAYSVFLKFALLLAQVSESAGTHFLHKNITFLLSLYMYF